MSIASLNRADSGLEGLNRGRGVARPEHSPSAEVVRRLEEAASSLPSCSRLPHYL